MKNLCLFFLCSLLCSCFTEQKANKQINRIEKHYPFLLGNKCSELFKPVVTKDTQIIMQFLSKIDTFLSKNTDTLIVIDTIKKECSKSVKELVIKLQSANKFIQFLKDDLRKNPPYIIKNIIDTSKIFGLTKEREKALKEKEDYRTRTEVMNKVCIWLLIFIIVLISYIYINETKPKLH